MSTTQSSRHGDNELPEGLLELFRLRARIRTHVMTLLSALLGITALFILLPRLGAPGILLIPLAVISVIAIRRLMPSQAFDRAHRLLRNEQDRVASVRSYDYRTKANGVYVTGTTIGLYDRSDKELCTLGRLESRTDDILDDLRAVVPNADFHVGHAGATSARDAQ